MLEEPFTILPGMPAPLANVQWFFFDLDGTLADSVTGLDASIRIAFEAVGRKLPVIDLRQWIGPGIRTIFRNIDPALTADELDRMERAFRAHYDTDGVLQTRMFEGVPTLLRALKQARRKLYIITNKPKLATGILLRGKGLETLFDAIVSRNSRDPAYSSKGEMLRCTVREHNVDVGYAAMIGDTEEDAEAAAQAGMRFLHAAYGYGSCAKPDTPRIQNVQELLRLCGLAKHGPGQP